MITHKSAPLFLLALMALPTCVLAGQFGHAGSDLMSTDLARSIEDAPAIGSSPAAHGTYGGDASLPYARSGSLIANDAPASVRESDADVEIAPTTSASPPARAIIPSASPSVPNRARAGNRWQSLVPGAIK